MHTETYLNTEAHLLQWVTHHSAKPRQQSFHCNINLLPAGSTFKSLHILYINHEYYMNLKRQHYEMHKFCRGKKVEIVHHVLKNATSLFP